MSDDLAVQTHASIKTDPISTPSVDHLFFPSGGIQYLCGKSLGWVETQSFAFLTRSINAPINC